MADSIFDPTGAAGGPLTTDQVMQATQQAPLPAALAATPNPIMPSMASAMQPAASADPLESAATSRLAKASQLLDALDALRAQQAAMGQSQSPTNPTGIPKSSVLQEPWMKMAPVRGQGFLGGLKNLGEDIGRAVVGGVASTGPGQAVQAGVYGPGVRRYEAQRQSLADQIQSIKEQAQLEEQPVAALGELSYHKALIGTREDANAIRQQAVAEKAKNDADRTDIERQKLALAGQKFQLSRKDADRRYQTAMPNISLRAKSLDERTLNDQRNAALREYGDNLIALRIQAGYDEKTAQLDTTTDIANARLQAEHPAQRLIGSVPEVKPGQRKTLNLPSAPNINAGSGRSKSAFDWSQHPVAQ